MVFENLRLNINVTDDEFNSIYNERIRKLSEKHWTPVAVAKQASEFLVQRPGTHVLDIGSGAGKFCLIGAARTEGHFIGIEQREELVDLSNALAGQYSLNNARFIHANITSVRFSHYDAFYFYNSFYENITEQEKIDDSIIGNERFYNIYSKYVAEQLASLPVGTRLATYWGPQRIMPQSYQLLYSSDSGLVKFWQKAY
jgi:SAM-dependent methyltransferase